jgi:dTDP-4-amino-4,6-dideoxygalactose transaminase
MSIQVLKPKYHVEECLAEIEECLRSGWTGVGFKTTQFEDQWKRYTGLPNAHFVNSATSGLHLALTVLKRRYGWSDDDEVISTPLTFVSTNHAILYEGLQPVFADVDDSLCLSPHSIEERITSKTRAVMYVGFGGNAGELNAVSEVCRRHDLALVLDAAHMAGARYLDRHVGSEAAVTVFSFHSVKNLPTADSGMVCFRDAEDDERARRLSWMGITKATHERTDEASYKWRYDVPDVGFKYHGNSIMAAIGLVQLRYLDDDNARRRSLAASYRKALAEHARIALIPEAKACQSSQHLFQVRVGHRDEVMEELYKSDIYPGVHYVDNSSYPMYRHMQGACPNAAAASEELISLPLHLDLTEDDVSYVCSALIAAVEKVRV